MTRTAATRSTRVVVVLLLVALAWVGVGAASGETDDGGPRAEVPRIHLPADWQQRYHTTDPSTGLLRASVDAARRDRAVPTRLVPTVASAHDSIGNLSPCNYAIDSIRRLCPRGDTDGRRTMVVIGDSHARHWIGALEPIAKRNHYTAYFLAKSSCLASLVTPDLDDGRPWRGCADFHRFTRRSVEKLQPDLVVVSSSAVRGGVYDLDGDHVTGRPAVRQAVHDGNLALFGYLLEDAGRVVLLEDSPHPDRNVPGCLRDRDSLSACLSTPEPTRNVDTRDQERAAEEAGADVVSTRPWFCWQGVCPAVVGDRITFRDDQHLTIPFGATLTDSLAAALGLR